MTRGQFGSYQIDADAGLIYGKRGRPVGTLDTSGYVQIDTHVDGRRVMRSAHRWIWEYVNGPIPEGLEVNHINGVKTDNRIANLELVTHQQNIRHAYATGLKSNAGTKHPRSRLTNIQVFAIRALTDLGFTRTDVAARCRVSVTTVSQIARRETWTHLPEHPARIEDL